MARDRVFTEEQVINAVAELNLEGKSINGTSLRNKIKAGRPSALMAAYETLVAAGKVGMATTIDVVAPAHKTVELLPELQEMKNVLFGDLDRQIQEMNDTAHRIVEGRLNGAIAEANERTASAIKRETEAVEAQAQAYEQLEDVQDELADLREKAVQFEKHIASLQSEIKSKDKTIQERDQRINDLDRELKQTTDSLTKAESAKSKAEGKAETLAESLASVQSECDLTKQNLVSANSELADITARFNNNSTELVELKAQLQKSAQEHKNEMSDLQLKRDTERDRLMALVDEGRENVMASQQTVASLTGKVEALENVVKDLRGDLANSKTGKSI